MTLTGNPNTPTSYARTPGDPQPSAFAKRRAKSRRANSCKPCRDSKSRCSGGMPCTTCQRKRGKPECFYVTSPRKRERNNPREAHDSEQSYGEPFGSCRDVQQEPAKQGLVRGTHGLVNPQPNFCGVFSLSRSVDEFRLLLPTNERFREIINCVRPGQIFDLEDHAADNEPVIDLARLEQPSDSSDFQFPPCLRPLYVKYRSVRDLLDAGRTTLAWTAFPSLVRSAEIIGLDVDVSLVTTEADRDPHSGRYLWWLLVELDVRLSFLLGRRPFIAPFNRIPRPLLRASRQQERDLQQNIFDFSQYMIEVLRRLNGDKNDSHTMSSEEREIMLEADLTRLYELQLKSPRLPQNGLADTSLCIAIAEHHIDVQLMLMVLHCQTLRSTRDQRKVARKGNYKELLKCTRTVTEMFDYIHGLDPTRTASSWPRCFGVFCAAVMLGIATIRQEVDVSIGSKCLRRTLGIFGDLAKAGQASGLAHLALKSLDLLSAKLGGIEHPTTIATSSTATSTVTRSTATTDVVVPSAPPLGDLTVKVKKNIPSLKRRKRSSAEGKLRVNRRQLFELTDITPGGPVQRPPVWLHGADRPYPQASPAFNHSSASTAQDRPAQDAFQQKECLPLTASTSFNANDQRGLSNVGYGSAQLEHFHEYQVAYHWVHPPMMYHPPMYDDWWQTQFTSYDAMTPDYTRPAFYGPLSGLPMDQTRHLGPTMCSSGGHAGFAHRKQEPATHDGTAVVINPSNAHPLGSA